jgi:hypothetical protein
MLQTGSALLVCCQDVADDAPASDVQHVVMRDWSTSTLGERIHHMCTVRETTLNKLGEKAGIKSGPMSRLGRKTVRVAGAPETLQRLAHAWDFDLDWLVDGRGNPEKLRAASADRYPNRAAAIEIARMGGMPSAVLDRASAEVLDLYQDAPILWWIRRLILQEQLFEVQPPEAAKKKKTCYRLTALLCSSIPLSVPVGITPAATEEHGAA